MTGFDAYFAAYAEAFNAFDAARITSFYHCPCLMVSAGLVAELRREEDIRRNMEALLEHHRQQQVGRASVARLKAEAQGARLAMATVGWEVSRRDGSPLWSFRNTYNLIELGAGWKILVSTTHEG